ncbi:MAG: thioredoxin domain-containing protein [Paludibacter sp.]
MNSTQHKHTNQLIHESSPYLLQHAHNPVNWYPWGQEALDKAQYEHKLIIVSIGYAACHWCHVMEHESFESEEVANYMNANFVCIKVDREERPDIDQVYMNAVQLISGQGGWPLNCITLPDGRPIWGGTYYPTSNWLDMLAQVSNFVIQNPDKAEHQAKTLTQGIQSSEMIVEDAEKPDYNLSNLHEIFDNWKSDIDYVEGGQNRAPKFPLPVGYQFLLHYHHVSKNKDALKAVTVTLDKMANGGIYDQIGCGFSRYSTDAVWKVPHFEKMLYDNAQLVSLYSAAFQQTKNPYYKTIVNETLEFVERELTSEEGGFYASLDADSEGVEGKFYVWTANEMKEVLGKNADLMMDYYNVTEEGNWEDGVNILLKKASDKAIAHKYNITESKLTECILEAKDLLLKKRSKRVRPGLDDKMLTSWNGLMTKGYIDAYRAFDDEKYLEMALRNAEFIIQKLKADDNRLNRNYKNGKATINGFLDDYAFTIDAFIGIYQATFDEKWLTKAQQLTIYCLTHFFDVISGMFYYTSDMDASLIARKMELSDNVIPSSNSAMAKNLYVLGHYFYNESYIEMAKTMLGNVKKSTLKGGAYYANWDILMTWMASEPYEVAIVGKHCEAKRKEFDKHYLPNVFLSGGKTEGTLSVLEGRLVDGETTIYVCQNKVCGLPVREVEESPLNPPKGELKRQSAMDLIRNNMKKS